MLQLVYVSTPLIPTTPSAMRELCQQARRNNSRDEITGMLVAKGGRFVQAIEGPQAAVEDTFLRIIADPRHRDLLLISRRLTGRREYGDWEMRHCAQAEDCPGFDERIGVLLRAAPAHIQQAVPELLY